MRPSIFLTNCKETRITSESLNELCQLSNVFLEKYIITERYVYKRIFLLFFKREMVYDIYRKNFYNKIFLGEAHLIMSGNYKSTYAYILGYINGETE